MASGGRDSQTDAGSDGTDSARGQPTPGMVPIQLNQFNLLTPEIHQAQINAHTVGVQGPAVFVMNPYARFQAPHRRPDVEDQALFVIQPPEDLSDKFTEDELGRVIEEKYLSYVANSCDENANWRRLARKLKLDPPSVTRIETNYGDNIREFLYQLLLSWKRRHAELKVGDLVKVLCESKLQKAVLELKSYFSSIHN